MIYCLGGAFLESMISLRLEAFEKFLNDFAVPGVRTGLFDKSFSASLDSSAIYSEFSSNFILLSYHCSYVFRLFFIVQFTSKHSFLVFGFGIVPVLLNASVSLKWAPGGFLIAFACSF